MKQSAKWKLNAVMAVFVLLTSTRFATTTLIDSIDVKNDMGEDVDYKHPFTQSVLGYLGEFLIIAFIAAYYKIFSPQALASPDNTSTFKFAVPALCDWFENMTMIFAVTQIFPSVVTLSRALVLPITAILSKWLIRTVFTWQMIAALILTLGGMTLASYI